MKNCIQRLYNFYTKNNNDNIFKFIIIFLNTLNLFIFIDTPYCVPITISLILVYYYISKLDIKSKKKIIMTWITFSIFTILGESLIISNNTGTSLKYNNSDIYNVSSWLFSAYASMVLAITLIADYYNDMLD